MDTKRRPQETVANRAQGLVDSLPRYTVDGGILRLRRAADFLVEVYGFSSAYPDRAKLRDFLSDEHASQLAKRLSDAAEAPTREDADEPLWEALEAQLRNGLASENVPPGSLEVFESAIAGFLDRIAIRTVTARSTSLVESPRSPMDVVHSRAIGLRDALFLLMAPGDPAKDETIKRLRRLIELVAELFSKVLRTSDFKSLEIRRYLSPPLSEKLADALKKTAENPFDPENESLLNDSFLALLHAGLQTEAGEPEGPPGEATKAVEDTFERALVLNSLLSARFAEQKLELVLSEAQQSVKHAQEAAGIVAEGELALSFSHYAVRQRRSANWLRASVVALTMVVTAGTVWLAGFHESGVGSWLELVRKLSITIPAAVLAAYLARESSHHRRNAEWAEAISVQLRTINAFTDSLSDESKLDIRSEFGRRVFGHASLAASPNESGTSIPELSREKIVTLVQAVLETQAKK